MPKDNEITQNPFAEDIYRTLEEIWDDFQKDMERIKTYLAELEK